MWKKDFRDMPMHGSSRKRRNTRRHDKGWNSSEKSKLLTNPDTYEAESNCRSARLVSEYRYGRRSKRYAKSIPVRRILKGYAQRWGFVSPEQLYTEIRRDCGVFSIQEYLFRRYFRYYNSLMLHGRIYRRHADIPLFIGRYPDCKFVITTKEKTNNTRRTPWAKYIDAGQSLYRLNAYQYLLQDNNQWYLAYCVLKNSAKAITYYQDNLGVWREERHFPVFEVPWDMTVVKKEQISRSEFNFRISQSLKHPSKYNRGYPLPVWSYRDEDFC